MPAATHRLARTPTYNVWTCMKQRCLNARHPQFADYGGRGIVICDRWLLSFENFLADMGEKPDQLTLERREVNGGYCLENCEWATRTVQSRNRRNNVILEYAGKRMTMAEWARAIGVSPRTLAHRIKLGWPVAKIVTTPADSNANRSAMTIH